MNPALMDLRRQTVDTSDNDYFKGACDDHKGGCVLYEKRQQVEELL